MNHSLQDFYAILHYPHHPIFLLKDIIPFWKSYKPHWFSHLPLHEFQPIHTIYENTPYHNLSLLLHYDQIIRHPTHLQSPPNKLPLKFATHIALRILHTHYDELEDWQKVFTLLTLRHNPSLKMKYFVLNKIYKELHISSFAINETSAEFKPSPLWLRFLEATMYDIFKHRPIQLQQPTNEPISSFSSILERPIQEPLSISFEDEYTYPKIAISLSGGVDSALLAYLFSSTNKDILLLHICYHNRPECEQELKFLNYFAYTICKRPLYVLHIDCMKRMRNTQYRDTYERTTRNLRFNFYKSFNCPIILGHNQDDTLENVFTNLASSSHYQNLFGMSEISTENEITILRPFINTTKAEIHELAELYKIPHLKNSTPSWSKRGQLRDSLIPFIDRFNPNILRGLTSYIEQSNHLHTEWSHSIQQYLSTSQSNDNTHRLEYTPFFIRNYTIPAFWIEVWKHIKLEKWPSQKSTSNMIDFIMNGNQVVLSPTLSIHYKHPHIYIYNN